MTQVLTVALVAAVLIAADPIAAEAQNWKPTKPITIIVPWPAGGATDQVTRLTAKELEPALGSTVVVVNQPGASGSIGKKSVADGPRTAMPGPPVRPSNLAPTSCSDSTTPTSRIGACSSPSPMSRWSASSPTRRSRTWVSCSLTQKAEAQPDLGRRRRRRFVRPYRHGGDRPGRRSPTNAYCL